MTRYLKKEPLSLLILPCISIDLRVSTEETLSQVSGYSNYTMDMR